MKTQATGLHTESVGVQPRMIFHPESHKNNRSFPWLRAAVICAMVVALAGALSAEPITFYFTGTCTAAVGPTTRWNVTFTLTLSTDTTQIQSSPPAFFTLPVAGAGIDIQYLGSGTFTQAWQILDDQSNGLIEFTDSIHGTVLGGTNSTFLTYNLQSAIGPVVLNGPTTFGLFKNIPTTLGSVTISNVSNVTFSAFTGGGTWTHVTTAPFSPNFTADTCLLLTDGTVACHQGGTSAWFRLAPDAFGNYFTGTWSQMASMPPCISGDCPGDPTSTTPPYAPTSYASAVLADGQLYVVGGENNGNVDYVDVNMGAYYDPVINMWTALPAPWPTGQVGDVQSVVLNDGTFMLAKHGFGTAFLPPGCRTTACFTPATTMQDKADINNEEGWTLLPLLPGGLGFFLFPSPNVLVVNVSSSPGSQVYTPTATPSTSGFWTNAGNTGTVNLVDQKDLEIGPQVLRPDGSVIVFGGSGENAVYYTSSDIFVDYWADAPPFPIINGQQLDVADGPAALLPNGNVLVGASPGFFNRPTYFYEWDGTSLIQVPAPLNAPVETTSFNHMLVLPTGQILFNELTGFEVYTESPSTTYNAAWQPTITSYPISFAPGSTNLQIFGTQFNGLSQGAMYGDDAQTATNYPLVRLTDASGHVFYMRTHDHSTMAVATGTAAVFTFFDVPLTQPTGTYNLEVVANGIPSIPVAVQVK
jgi:hypothetical protein